MKNPTDPKKKKGLSFAAVSGLGFLLLSLLGIAGFFLPLKFALSRIDHSEKVLRTGLDYSDLTRLSRISFSPNAIACKWELREKDNRSNVFSILVPSPSDFDTTISGYVIVTEEETENMLAKYDWKPVSKDDPPEEIKDRADRIKKEQADMLDAMGLRDKTLLYSNAFENEIQQSSPYASLGTILFDAEHNRLYFHLKHM